MDEKKYVSRGGLKLEKARESFGVDVTDLTVLNVRSSTGGVDCLLRLGVKEKFLALINI
jgi:23S rRNA (cytidine1920-2'-O)/16S rRNA (cytidine1409-2'-O)-methyltransferase